MLHERNLETTPGGAISPTVGRLFKDVNVSITKLWKAIAAAQEKTVRDMPFVLSDSIYVSTSPPYRVGGSGGIITGLLFQLGTPGSTNTVIRLLKNGSTFNTYTLAANESWTTFGLSCSLQALQDYVNIEIVTVGSGAKDLNVQLRIRLN